MKEKVHILIVEDEKNISDILKFNLEKKATIYLKDLTARKDWTLL